jgi:hypothetical protein
MFKSTFRLLTGRKGDRGDADPEHFIAAAMEGLNLPTSRHSATWHLGEEEGWSADLMGVPSRSSSRVAWRPLRRSR